MSDKRSQILKIVITLSAILLIVMAAYFLFRYFGIEIPSREEIQHFIESSGAIAPLIYIFVSFLQVTFVPIPGAVTIIAGNYVFGPIKAFVYSYIGMLLGSVLAFYLGRWIGRPFVNWVAGDKKKVDGWIEKLKGREKILLFYMFFLPVFPDDLLCSVAGILPITSMTFLLMQLITRATSVFFTLVFMSGAVSGWTYVFCVIGAALTLPVFIYCFKNADRVNAYFASLGKRILSCVRRADKNKAPKNEKEED